MELVAVADDQLGVSADVHHGDGALLTRQAGGQQAGGGVRPDVGADQRQRVNPAVGMDRQQRLFAALGQVGAGAFALAKLVLGDRSIRHLAKRIHVQPEEQVAHDRVADQHHLVNAPGRHAERLDRPAHVTGERTAQQPALVVSVELHPRQYVGAAEALGILERLAGLDAAGLEINQAHRHSGGAQVHGQTVQRAGGSVDFLAIEQHPVAIACHRRVKRRRLVEARQANAVLLDLNRAALQCLAANCP